MQAAIITAYRDLEQVKMLVDILSEKFEIYIHVDKRVPAIDLEKSGLLEKKGRSVNVYQKFSVNWGSPNHLWGILYCMRNALKNPHITYLHIISGEDFPVKSVEEIYDFFEGKEDIYCEFSKLNLKGKNRKRIQRWQSTYSFLNIFNYKKLLPKIVVKAMVAFKVCIGVNRLKRLDVELAQGLVWGSYPRKAIEYCLNYACENPDFISFLEYGYVSEEFFFSTILSNSDYWKNRIAGNNYRYMSWEKRNGSYPAILDESDIYKIQQGDYMFARKIRRPISDTLLSLLDLSSGKAGIVEQSKEESQKSGRVKRERKKVLLVGMTSTAGGLERYIMNFFSGIDREIYSVDFLNQEPSKCLAYEEQIKMQGGNIVLAVMRDKHFFKHYFELLQIFKKKYDIVYYNTLDLSNIDFLLYAKLFNKKTVKIVHAHNSQGAQKGIRYLLMKCHQKVIIQFSDKRYACSKLAGDWTFAGKDYKVIHNAIDLDRFRFDLSKKRNMTKQLGLDGKIVWGTVGRLAEQKNPLFLVEIMKYAHELNSDIVFLHIGKGELKSEMQIKIRSYNLENNYFLLGELKNVEDYYQVMEKFIFPSLFEGFGYAALEAQAMGIQTFITEGNNLSKEVDVHAGCMTHISLEKTAKEWANEIIRIPAIPDNRRNEYGEYVKKAGFDLKDNRISF